MGEDKWRYNYLHSSARMAVERAFGLLKKRFRFCNAKTTVKNPTYYADMIDAACILHNICLHARDRAVQEDPITHQVPIEFERSEEGSSPDGPIQQAAIVEFLRDQV